MVESTIRTLFFALFTFTGVVDMEFELMALLTVKNIICKYICRAAWGFPLHSSNEIPDLYTN